MERASEAKAAAMERPTEGMEMEDRLSDLPEHVLLHIISFLPTKIAARTTVLSRRFRGLWECSPVVELDISHFRDLQFSHFADLANRTIIHRDPPSPLHRLSLILDDYIVFDASLLTDSYISSLLLKAASLGLRHLTIELESDRLLTMSPLIFSLSRLESLSLVGYDCARKELLNPLPPITLEHLKTLSIEIRSLDNDVLNYITSHLNALEDLHLHYMDSVTKFFLNSVVIRRLKLLFDRCCRDVKISTPSLEFFEFSGAADSFLCPNNIQWEMPLLKKAIIQLTLVYPQNVPTICEILKVIAHVDELHLEIEEMAIKSPFHALLVPGVELPTYVTLKHLNLKVCFHKYNFENLVTLLEHAPALESLKLIHKPARYYWKDKAQKLWSSKLPKNDEGHYKHEYFKDLQIDGKRKVLIEQLTRKISKKQKV